MDDINGNLEQVIFKCDQCGEKFTFVYFLFAIALYGVIFLTGREDGYWGIVCPKCKKTSLKKANRKYIESIKGRLNQLSQADGSQEERIRYYSVPYNLDDYQGRMLNYGSPTIIPLDDSPDILEFSDYFLTPPNDASIDLSDAYRTYFRGDPAMGPAMVSWFFKKEAIDDLVEMENETGLKVFPRYAFHDSLIETIDAFCWQNHCELEFVNYFKEFAPSSVKMEVIGNPWQKRITRNSDFLKILSNTSCQSGNLFPSSFNSLLNVIQPFDDLGFQMLMDDLNVEKQIITGDGQTPTDMIDELWKNVNKEHIQETLSILSNRFIFEYIELAHKIDCSWALVWDLKEKYLKQLYDSVKSEHKRRLITNRVPEVELREVQKAENLFPELKKIKSGGSKIIEIKIELGRLAQYKKQYKEEVIDFLLLGERGTGKELFARAINEMSERGQKKFVCVNCAAIPERLFESELFGSKKGSYTDAYKDQEGLLEQADHGTIFFDEIGDLDRTSQAKLLRLFQEREIQTLGATPKKVDVIIILATNRDLDEMAKKGDFRSDLYDRFSENTFMIPPLRERKNDIPLLVKHFIEKYDKEGQRKPDLPSVQVTNDCMDLLEKYEWPGNVRTLEKAIRRIMRKPSILHDRKNITPSDLPQDILNSFPSEKTMPELGKGKRNLPSDDELARLIDEEGLTKQAVADRYGVYREHVSRTYSKIKREKKKANRKDE